MSDTSGSSNTAIVAIVAVLILIAGFFAYQNGMFGHKEKAGVDIELNLKN